jgi:hypothetical protein
LFQVLPGDLSSWELVANLNISGLNLANFEDAVRALSTMPALKSLYVNLHEESQVDLIMQLLPQLEFLNSLPVDREAMEESEAGDVSKQHVTVTPNYVDEVI